MEQNNWGIINGGKTLAEIMVAPSAPAPVQNNTTSSNLDVYFSEDVEDASILTLIKSLREKEQVSLDVSNKFGIPPIPIKLYISSNGGSLFAGFGASDVIRTLKVPVHTFICGHAASAATILSVMGTKRFMYKRSHILIHQLASFCWGKHDKIKDEVENLDNFMSLIKDFYAQYTKISRKQLDNILKRDMWFDAKTALQYGLIDEIL